MTPRIILLSAIVSSMPLLWAQAPSIEEETKVHRLASTHRSIYDAFVYANRIPENPDEGESASDLAGRIHGRLANQEGRIQLKLPPEMGRDAYLGFKTFLGSDADQEVTNCVACHAPAGFGASPDGSLRNHGRTEKELEAILRDKMALAAAGNRHYAGLKIKESDLPGLIAFLNTLNDVPNAGFRNSIVNAQVLDTTREPDADGAVITGVVRLHGKPPKRKPILLTPDTKPLYDEPPLDEGVLVNSDGGIANVFVYVKRGLEKLAYAAPAEPAVLNQEKSMFRPRVQGIMVGQEVLMRNSDPYIHNVRSMSLKNRPFNLGQPANTPDRKKIFDEAEGPITLKCDFHPWMTAHFFVMDHPFFAVTGEHGRLRITGLPPGDYTLEAWHEVFGTARQKIKVPGRPGEGPSVVFTFRPK